MGEMAAARAVGLAHLAVTAPELWGQAARAMAKALGASSAVWGMRHADGSESGGICPDTDPEWHDRYAREFAHLNHLWSRAAAAPEGSVIVAEAISGADDWRRSALYRGFVRPQGMDSVLALVVARGPDQAALMSFGRPLGQDGFSETDAALAARLGRMIASAARAATRSGGAMFCAQLDRVNAATFLCDAGGRVQQISALAEAALLAGKVCLSAGRLSIPGLPGLARAIAHAARPRLCWPPPLGGDFLTPDGRAVRVAPWCGASGAWAEVDPLALVIVESDRRGMTAHAMAARYGLTQREAVVIGRLARGMTLPEVARAEGIALSTARSHLQHVFDKTGVRTQNALLAMLAPRSWPEPPDC